MARGASRFRWHARRVSTGPARLGSNFDLLRLGAASAVVFSHSLLVVTAAASYAAYLVSPFRQIGDDALAVFFVVSGILVTQSWQRDPDLGRYLARRALRLMPALIVAVALTSLVLGPIASQLTAGSYLRSPGSWAYLLNGTVFFQPYALPGVFEHLPQAGMVNGPLWTLRYEFVCYLAVPLLFAIVTVLRRRAVVLGFWLLAVGLGTMALTADRDFVLLGINPMSIAGLPGAAGWNYAPLVVLASYFLAGMCIQIWLPRIRFDGRIAVAAIPVFIVCSQVPLFFPLSVITLAYPVATFGLRSRSVMRVLVSRGDGSYGIYVWGFVVEQFTVLWLGPRLSALVVFAIAMPVTWAVGIVSWRLVERPALRLKPRSPTSPVAGARSRVRLTGSTRTIVRHAEITASDFGN